MTSTYKIMVDGFKIREFEAQDHMNEIQRRVITEAFANDMRISPKGVRVVSG